MPNLLIVKISTTLVNSKSLPWKVVSVSPDKSQDEKMSAGSINYRFIIQNWLDKVIIVAIIVDLAELIGEIARGGQRFFT